MRRRLPLFAVAALAVTACRPPTASTDFSPTASWRVVYRRNAERRLKAPPPGT